MAFKKLYKAQFSNTQVDYSDNSANPQDVFITIEDKAHEAIANPYGIELSAVETNPGINITINLTINSDTSNYSNVSVEASADGSTWTEVLTQANPVQGTDYINLISYETYTQYIVKFTLISPPDEEVVYIQEDVIIPIETAEDPVIISVVDTDEDKFTPIRSKSCTIRLLTSNDIDVSTFTSGGDKDFAVTIAVGAEDKIIFSGLLSVEDIHQEFQPHPNILSLTATDGLGFLKDIPFPGADMLGENKIIDYIATCLQLTGLSLEILVENNIREETAGLTDAGHFYNFCYLHTGTFERSVNEYDSCFEVLEKILGESCELSQQKNRWFIKRIDEFDTQDSKQCLFSASGVLEGMLLETKYSKNIGVDESIAFMNDDAVISRTRPHKSVTHTFNFITPEIPCNAQFERGEFIGTLPDEVIEGETFSVKKYNLDCWTLLKDVHPPTHPVAATINSAFIKRWFNEYNEERFKDVVITYPDPYPNASRLESQFVYMDKNDKFDLSYKFKYSENISGGNANFLSCHIRLQADNGDVYFFDDNDSAWHIADSTWSNIRTISVNFTPNDIDETEWQDVSVNVGKLPVSGKIIVAIYWGNISDLSGIDLHISDFKINYNPFIAGAYEIYKGQRHIVEQSVDYVSVREKEVFISDSPKKIFKGALLKLVAGEYVLTGGFWNFAVFPGGAQYVKPYGEMQTFDVWNQYRSQSTVIDGTVDGIDTDKTDILGLPDLIDLQHTIYITDVHSLTTNRQFKVLHGSQNLDLSEGDVYLIEVFNGNKSYTGHTFKYVTNDRQ